MSLMNHCCGWTASLLYLIFCCCYNCSYLGDEADGGHCREQRADYQDDSSRAHHLLRFPHHHLHQWVQLPATIQFSTVLRVFSHRNNSKIIKSSNNTISENVFETLLHVSVSFWPRSFQRVIVVLFRFNSVLLHGLQTGKTSRIGGLPFSTEKSVLTRSPAVAEKAGRYNGMLISTCKVPRLHTETTDETLSVRRKGCRSAGPPWHISAQLNMFCCIS